MDKLIIQISAGRGPVECSRVVAKVQELMIKSARKADISVAVLDSTPGDHKGTLLSATLMAEGNGLKAFVTEWEGTIQWTAPSPYRPMYKRKNWFVGIAVFDIQQLMDWNEKDVVFDTCRASGPGGQNVNKVETAVRGTHKPSGIQVLAMDGRSQWQNRKLCLERLKGKVTAWRTAQLLARQQDQWQEHNELERGNAVKTIKASLL